MLKLFLLLLLPPRRLIPFLSARRVNDGVVLRLSSVVLRQAVLLHFYLLKLVIALI